MNTNKIIDLLNKDHVKLLFSIFEKNNAKIRLVGGCIRDKLIDREVKDIDTATNIEPFKSIINDFKCGELFQCEDSNDLARAIQKVFNKGSNNYLKGIKSFKSTFSNWNSIITHHYSNLSL